jgi:hypothetical protein
MIRVLVCGQRDFSDKVAFDTLMDHLSGKMGGFSCVIEGEAKGVDTLARVWAEERGILVEKYPADWKKFGAAAGPIRNKQMLVEGKPDLVVAVYSNKDTSKGTRNMVDQSKKAGLEVLEYELK